MINLTDAHIMYDKEWIFLVVGKNSAAAREIKLRDLAYSHGQVWVIKEITSYSTCYKFRVVESDAHHPLARFFDLLD